MSVIYDNVGGEESIRVYGTRFAYDELRELAALKSSGRLSELLQAEREGRCVVVPYKIGDMVYVISKCDWVGRKPDGTLYGEDGGPGTATGYYCAYDGREDDCPLAAGRDECDMKGYAVFEETIEQITVVSDKGREEPDLYIGLSHVVEYLDGKIYATRAEAEAELEKEGSE
jgi:hypothetical protein